MGKNNKLINQMKALAAQNRAEAVEKASNEITPQIYAAFAIALHRECGWGFMRISRVFAESQKIWEEFSGRGREMMDLCEKETGITVMFEEKHC